MANLFWKTGKGTRALLDKPFGSEDEFERMVFSTSELLKDIFLLKRQIRGGNKTGIPDILGIDREGSVCKMAPRRIVSRGQAALQSRTTLLLRRCWLLVTRYWISSSPDVFSCL